MADIRGHGWVIHRVGQVAYERDVNAPTHHLFNGKRTIENTHIGVYAHDQHLFDLLLGKVAVDLPAIVRDQIALLIDDHSWMLPAPRFVGCRFTSIGALIGGVHWQWRIVMWLSGGWRNRGDGQHTQPCRMVTVEIDRLRRRVDDLHATAARRGQHLVHRWNQRCFADNGAATPMVVPHVTDDDGEFVGRYLLLGYLGNPAIVAVFILAQLPTTQV